MKKIEFTVVVKNALGLHARPAARIVELLKQSKSQVTISYREQTINARSILSILMLAVEKDKKILVTVEGEDARATADQLEEAFEHRFGEVGS